MATPRPSAHTSNMAVRDAAKAAMGRWPIEARAKLLTKYHPQALTTDGMFGPFVSQGIPRRTHVKHITDVAYPMEWYAKTRRVPGEAEREHVGYDMYRRVTSDLTPRSKDLGGGLLLVESAGQRHAIYDRKMLKHFSDVDLDEYERTADDGILDDYHDWWSPSSVDAELVLNQMRLKDPFAATRLAITSMALEDLDQHGGNVVYLQNRLTGEGSLATIDANYVGRNKMNRKHLLGFLAGDTTVMPVELTALSQAELSRVSPAERARVVEDQLDRIEKAAQDSRRELGDHDLHWAAEDSVREFRTVLDRIRNEDYDY